MRRIIGQGVKISKSYLAPNSKIACSLQLTDTLGKKFSKSSEFSTDSRGFLNISEYELQREIWQASNENTVSSRYSFSRNNRQKTRVKKQSISYGGDYNISKVSAYNTSKPQNYNTHHLKTCWVL